MLTKFYFTLYNLLHSEEGQDLAEYAIMLGIIAVAVILVIITIGSQVSNVFQQFTTEFATVPGAGE